jgi:2-C-methyl-D-erythritol 4-phosphate cytidylyltransferase
MKYSAVITAGGTGNRVGLEYNKILIDICGKKVIDYSFDFFKNDVKCTEIICVVNKNDYEYFIGEYQNDDITFVIGGDTRQQSVFNGLGMVKNKYVLIHDSARPYINKEKIDHLLKQLNSEKAVSLAIPVTDSTIIHSGNRFVKALNRNSLLAIQTPQGFHTNIIKEAHIIAVQKGYEATDDTDLIAHFTKHKPYYVNGDNRSIKLTTKFDIEILKVILCSE